MATMFFCDLLFRGALRFIRSRAFVPAALALSLNLAVKCCGQGTIIQVAFDGPPKEEPPGGSVTITNYDEEGMSFTPILPSGYFTRVWPISSLNAYDGTIILRAGRPEESLMFRFTNGAVFQIVSVDLAEFNIATGPATVSFLGYRHDGSTVSTNFITDGVIDNDFPLKDFQTFHFSPQFSNLDRVEVLPTRWSLDNLVVNIPEPDAFGLCLLAAALAGTGLFRRMSCR
jgi:hypothetical protein